MPLDAFNHLRLKHPERLSELGLLELMLEAAMSRTPSELIDDRIIAQVYPTLDMDFIRDILVELVDANLLKPTFLWTCPHGNGTAIERERLEDFPSTIECPRCGERHTFHQDEIEVHFVIANTLEQASASRA